MICPSDNFIRKIKPCSPYLQCAIHGLDAGRLQEDTKHFQALVGDVELVEWDDLLLDHDFGVSILRRRPGWSTGLVTNSILFC